MPQKGRKKTNEGMSQENSTPGAQVLTFCDLLCPFVANLHAGRLAID
jgi:hypothetical protein